MKALSFLPALAFLAGAAFAAPSLTIYNQNFAVVRDTVPLDLKAGVNDASFSDMTATAETDSVILSDPSGKVNLRILDQSYRNDPVSQELLLKLNEGKTIDFQIHEPNKPDRVVQGKIVRAGHDGPMYAQMAEIYEPGRRVIQLQRPNSSPIIEVDGKLQFSLPGEPVFPSLGDDTILNPTLSWKLDASETAKLDAEIAYITDGLSWHADYNLVSREKGDIIDIVGWVTFDNQSGKTFRDAKIKLMAGDVHRVEEVRMEREEMQAEAAAAAQMAEPVTEKAFSEFHIYTIGQPTTLRDHETKQVEFVRAQGVSAPTIYVYDGATTDYGTSDYGFLRGAGDYDIPMNKKIWVLREFKNSKENNLGMPLPKGRLRFYQQDDDKSLQFVGENEIDHTPKDETVRVYIGNSFDLTGERKRTDYKVDLANQWAQEDFEIKLRNHKKEPVEIRVVEHLCRYDNWELKEKSDDFRKLDANTIEFRVRLKPDEERIVTCRVHYTW